MLAEFQDECGERTGSRKMYGIATAAFREAENGQDISLDLLQLGIQIKILTDEDESVYAYEAATLGKEGLAVVDLGSRTTEFVNKQGDRYEWRVFPIGYKVAWDDYYDKAASFSRGSGPACCQIE